MSNNHLDRTSHIEKLTWDTEFFGFNVARVFLNNNNDLERIVPNLWKEGTKLIYVFSKSLINDIDLIDKLQGKLVDIKITYSKIINASTIEKPPIVMEYNSSYVTQNLYDLALDSGEYSRFKSDMRLPNGTFEKMYKLWIEKAVKKSIADKVYFLQMDNEVIGFVSLKLNDKYGEIGLIGIKREFQGKGFGKRLLTKAENYTFIKGLKEIRVATQFANIRACGFYKKNGYLENEPMYIYHFLH